MKVFHANKLFDLVRINIIAVDRVAAIVARKITLITVANRLLKSGIGLSEDACPLAMGKLTALSLTDAGVAEVGAFESMAIGAADTLVAVTVQAKGTAYRSTR
ncbi:hypothetical protein SLS53_003135 [Cytospora paraplurivora]|uniref:Uncharacterized protein n=1 Tax=Cytospora paraplurivora TaxID=2898453 RepID=A0AAN9YJ99_9PEZI